MSIFNGVEILFFFLGVITTLGMTGLVVLHKLYKSDWKTTAVLFLGSCLFLFTLAWFFSSILEGEPRAANMGFLFFGLPAIILLGRAGRKLYQKQPIVSDI